MKVNFYVNLPGDHKNPHNQLIKGLGSKVGELRKSFEDLGVSWQEFVAPQAPGLLGALQQSILHDKDLEKGNGKDGSIVVNACHTPIREVEVLYDYLLDLFENDKGQGKLRPADILVMTPDIGKYEPFVRAVFRNAPARSLPFKVIHVRQGETLFELYRTRREGQRRSTSINRTRQPAALSKHPTG